MKHFHVLISDKIVGEIVCKEHRVIASPQLADRNFVLPV